MNILQRYIQIQRNEALARRTAWVKEEWKKLCIYSMDCVLIASFLSSTKVKNICLCMDMMAFETMQQLIRISYAELL